MKLISPIPLDTPTKRFSFPFFGSLVLIILVAMISCGPPPPKNVSNQGQSGSALNKSKTPEIHSLDTAYFLNRMSDMSFLARSHPNEQTVLRSSHDPNDGPKDVGNFQGKYVLEGNTWHVLLDEKGPGCVTRLWITGQAEGRLRIYFDNAGQPTIDTTIQQFFAGDTIRSATYMIYKKNDSGGGYVSYFPLPFQSRCTILTDSTMPEFQYQVNVLKLAQNTKVTSYSPTWNKETEDAVGKANLLFGNLAFAHYENVSKTKFGPAKVEANSRKLLANLDGPSAIDYLQLKIDPCEADILKKIKLQMFWDNMKDPSVDCSLQDFFCYSNLNLSSWNAYPLGYYGDEKLFYCRFFMPFAKKAQIFLVNDTDKEIEITFEYHRVMKRWDDQSLYFFARTHRRDFIHGFTYPLLEFEGKGNFVGINLLSSSPDYETKFFGLDGDEYFYVDGERDPSWAGTGEDNYFNGDEKFSVVSHFYVPFHGCLTRGTEGGGFTHCFRFHFLDSIPFQTSLVMIKEIGDPNQFLQSTYPTVSTIHEWTTYWYGVPAESPVPRNEYLFYFAIDQQKDTQPSPQSPIVRDLSLQVKLPAGEWWFHVAPIWDLSKVQHSRQIVESLE